MKILITKKQFKNILQENIADKVYYHGSDHDFDNFNLYVNVREGLSAGLFITPDKRWASVWGDIIYTVKLKSNNIFDYRNQDHMRQYMEEVVKECNEDEFSDGVKITFSDVLEIFYGYHIDLILKKNKKKYQEYIKYFMENPEWVFDEEGDWIKETKRQQAKRNAANRIIDYPDDLTRMIMYIDRAYKIQDIDTNWREIEKESAVRIINGRLNYDGAYINEKKKYRFNDI